MNEKKLLFYGIFDSLMLTISFFILSIYRIGNIDFAYTSGIHKALFFFFCYRTVRLLYAYIKYDKQDVKQYFLVKLFLSKMDNKSIIIFRSIFVGLIFTILIVSLPFNSMEYVYELDVNEAGGVDMGVDMLGECLYLKFDKAEIGKTKTGETDVYSIDFGHQYKRLEFLPRKSQEEPYYLKLTFSALFIKFRPDMLPPEADLFRASKATINVDKKDITIKPEL